MDFTSRPSANISIAGQTATPTRHAEPLKSINIPQFDPPVIRPSSHLFG